MRNGFQNLEAALGQLRVEKLGEARAECKVLVHDHHRLRSLAALVVDRDQIVECGLGDDAEAGAEAEGVLQAASHDAVHHADVDNVGQVVARRGLAGGETDAAGVATYNCSDAGAVHLLDFGVAAFRRRLGIAENRFDLGPSQ